jgi:hypothetical protein
MALDDHRQKRVERSCIPSSSQNDDQERSPNRNSLLPRPQVPPLRKQTTGKGFDRKGYEWLLSYKQLASQLTPFLQQSIQEFW